MEILLATWKKDEIMKQKEAHKKGSGLNGGGA